MTRLLIAVLLAAGALIEASPALLSSLWSETGSHLDPDGAPALQGDEGPRLDPNG